MRVLIVAAALATIVLPAAGPVAAPSGAARLSADSGDVATPVRKGTRLGITVWLRGRPGSSFATSLRCAPPGGTHPFPRRACRRLRELADPFGPLPYELPCALVASGPQVAVVRGRFRGRPVEAFFDRSDSCETRRWERVAILFAAP